MKSYRVKVRDDKAQFFEELMRYLDFIDYEKVEGFSEPRIYPGFEIRSAFNKTTSAAGVKVSKSDLVSPEMDERLESIREAIQKIDAIRDKTKKRKKN